MKKLLYILIVCIIATTCMSCDYNQETGIAEITFGISQPKTVITADAHVPAIEDMYWDCTIKDAADTVVFQQQWTEKGLYNKTVKCKAGTYTISLNAYSGDNASNKVYLLEGALSNVTLNPGANNVTIPMIVHNTTAYCKFRVSGHIDGQYSSCVLKFTERNGSTSYFEVDSGRMYTDANNDLYFNSIEKTVARQDSAYEWDIVLINSNNSQEIYRIPFNIMLYGGNFVTDITVDVRQSNCNITVTLPSGDIVTLQ